MSGLYEVIRIIRTIISIAKVIRAVGIDIARVIRVVGNGIAKVIRIASIL